MSKLMPINISHADHRSTLNNAFPMMLFTSEVMSANTEAWMDS